MAVVRKRYWLPNLMANLTNRFRSHKLLMGKQSDQFVDPTAIEVKRLLSKAGAHSRAMCLMARSAGVY